MKRILRHLCLVAIAFAPFALQAQEVVYLSAAGNDGNSGSPTAPVHSLNTAYTKVYAGGTIVVMDPMYLNAAVISKSVTIDGGGKATVIAMPGVDHATSSGLVVAAGSTDTVVLRNMTIIQHDSSCWAGILFTSGKALAVEHCVINGFLGAGIDVETTSASNLSVADTTITGWPGNTASSGINVGSGSTGVKVDLDRVAFVANGHCGIYCGAGSLSASRVAISGSDYGLVAFGRANIELDGSTLNNNTVTGLRVAGGTVRLADCTITGNASGVSITGGTVSSFGNNRVAGNGSGNGPLGTPIAFQ